MSAAAAELRSPARRSVLGRVLGAVLVFRLELRPPAPLDAGLILLAWLRRPVIQMPVDRARVPSAGRIGERHDARSRTLRRLDEVYPF